MGKLKFKITVPDGKECECGCYTFNVVESSAEHGDCFANMHCVRCHKEVSVELRHYLFGE